MTILMGTTITTMITITTMTTLINGAGEVTGVDLDLEKRIV
jgi:hypothetical protein